MFPDCHLDVAFVPTAFGLTRVHALNASEIPVLNRPEISIHITHPYRGTEPLINRASQRMGSEKSH